jgi:hypothetical protein
MLWVHRPDRRGSPGGPGSPPHYWGRSTCRTVGSHAPWTTSGPQRDADMRHATCTICRQAHRTSTGEQSAAPGLVRPGAHSSSQGSCAFRIASFVDRSIQRRRCRSLARFGWECPAFFESTEGRPDADRVVQHSRAQFHEGNDSLPAPVLPQEMHGQAEQIRSFKFVDK